MCVFYGNELPSIVNASVFMQCSLIFTHASYTIWQWSWLQNTATSSETSPDRWRNKLMRLRSPKTAGWGERRGTRTRRWGGSSAAQIKFSQQGRWIWKGLTENQVFFFCFFYKAGGFLRNPFHWKQTRATQNKSAFALLLHRRCYPWNMQMFHFICVTMASAVLSDWKCVGQPDKLIAICFSKQKWCLQDCVQRLHFKKQNRE